MFLSSLRVRLRDRLRFCRAVIFGGRRVRLSNGVPLISFSFDDFPKSALHSGGRILEEHGLAGTYYAALGLMNADGPVGPIFSERDLQRVLARGHELGCHTFDHCDSWTTDPGAFEQSILRNGLALSRILPGASFSTFSYPRSTPRPQTKQKAGKYFLGCRAGGGRPFNDRAIDLNFLRAFFLEQSGGNFEVVKRLIDRTSRPATWLILATHDVASSPSRFGCTPEFFADVVRHARNSGATILPVARALELIHNPVVDGQVAQRTVIKPLALERQPGGRR